MRFCFIYMSRQIPNNTEEHRIQILHIKFKSMMQMDGYLEGSECNGMNSETYKTKYCKWGHNLHSIMLLHSISTADQVGKAETHTVSTQRTCLSSCQASSTDHHLNTKCWETDLNRWRMRWWMKNIITTQYLLLMGCNINVQHFFFTIFQLTNTASISVKCSLNNFFYKNVWHTSYSLTLYS